MPTSRFDVKATIHDVQIIRPGDAQNYGLSMLLISPVGENWSLLDAMSELTKHEGLAHIRFRIESEAPDNERDTTDA